MKLRVGTRLEMVPTINDYKNQPGCTKKLPCTVVYINRPHRFFTVQFDFLYGSFRESYKFFEKGDFACRKQ